MAVVFSVTAVGRIVVSAVAHPIGLAGANVAGMGVLNEIMGVNPLKFMGGDEEGLRLTGGTLIEEGPTLPLEVLEEEMAAAEALINNIGRI